ncbi:peptidase E [Candidatus Xianfuyuplasma coldseepsis]|uniref:Type 1 glutamine amidotransferase-like domain-containing protein n=1 Tax=Candidatus Xianfuyuplasma coldseepsis TaxID=2782163 RepID=A0A7L7KRW6_9MOLU|nr:peptidase E [Xianfuyuplasma coldseepsis]QMS85473.1 type 1 glutamine amidotransferase-like domain-containing protein [Xianfuyuplasma coldseepsis]
MVLLTSSGFITDSNIRLARKYIYKTYEKAVIIVTASSYKKQDKHIPELKEQLSKLGLVSELFDFDTDSIEGLSQYDVMVLGGGNPLYLMKQIQRVNAREIIEEFAKNRLLIGVSGGSIVLGKHMDIIQEFNPEFNDDVQLESYQGLNISVNTCPHYDRYQDRYDRFEERIQAVEDFIEAPIYRLEEDMIYVHQLRELSPWIQRAFKFLLFVVIFSMFSVIFSVAIGEGGTLFRIILWLFIGSSTILGGILLGWYSRMKRKRKTFKD